MEITSYDTKLGFYSPPDYFKPSGDTGKNKENIITTDIHLNKDEIQIWEMLKRKFL